MTEIWDEKPKTHHAGAYGIMTDVYASGVMNGWLEKVKAERDKWVEGYGDLDKLYCEQFQKLEAIKEWCASYKPPTRSFNKLNQEPFIQLEKILGAE